MPISWGHYLKSAQAAQARHQGARNSPILPGRSESVVRVFIKTIDDGDTGLVELAAITGLGAYKWNFRRQRYVHLNVAARNRRVDCVHDLGDVLTHKRPGRIAEYNNSDLAAR